MKTKSDIRREMMEILNGIEDKVERSKYLMSLIKEHGILQNVQTVLVFISFEDEVQTKSIVEYCWDSVIRVCVPEYEDHQEKNLIIARSWTRDSKLIKTDRGTLYPWEGDLIEMSDIDLILVPGLAFTEDGRRLGRGGGFYDRLLSDFTGRTVGLCFDEQIVDEIPLEKHDKKVEKVISC